MRPRRAQVAAIVGLCALFVCGCASSRTELSVVRVEAKTPSALAALLRRPVRTPKSCQLTKPVYLKKWGYALGRWPLRATFASHTDTAHESFRGRLFHGWWYSKVLWFEASPSYHGWLLVRGVDADRNQVGFLFGIDQRPRTALRFHASDPPPGQSAITWNTATLVPHGGCYAYQVDGSSFSYSIVVKAYR